MRARDRAVVAYLFLLPSLLGLLVFKIYPVLLSVRNSFYVSSFITREEIFVGLEHYISLAQDPVFWQSLRVTILFNVIVNPLQVTLALALAIFLGVQFRGIHLIRSLYMLPIGISLPVATVIWGVVLNPHSGLMNSLLATVSLSPQPFLTSPTQALWSIILIATWKGVSYWMIFLLAGIKGIPESLYDAARIDGANAWQMFTRITLPLLKRVLLFVVVADTISNFLLFVPPYLLTQGGPQLSTNLLMYEAFKTAFIYVDMYRSMALVTVLLTVLFLVIAIQFRFLRATHEY
jgi:multiple sugar transport system permease protein